MLGTHSMVRGSGTGQFMLVSLIKQYKNSTILFYPIKICIKVVTFNPILYLQGHISVPFYCKINLIFNFKLTED